MAYSPTMMRWLQQDPAGYVDGPNAYQFVLDNPNSLVDALGLQTTTATGPATTRAALDLPALKADAISSFSTLIQQWAKDKKIDATGIQEAKQDAEKIVDAYFDMWHQYAYARNSYAIRVPSNKGGLQDFGEAHAGWMCWQWKEFTYAAVSGLQLKRFGVYKSGNASVYFNKTYAHGVPDLNSGIKTTFMEHNWVTVSLDGDCEKTLKGNHAPGERYTLRLDPWIKTSPRVYTPEGHGWTANVWDFGPSVNKGDVPRTGSTTTGADGRRYLYERLNVGGEPVMVIEPSVWEWDPLKWRKTEGR